MTDCERKWLRTQYEFFSTPMKDTPPNNKIWVYRLKAIRSDGYMYAIQNVLFDGDEKLVYGDSKLEDFIKQDLLLRINDCLLDPPDSALKPHDDPENWLKGEPGWEEFEAKSKGGKP